MNFVKFTFTDSEYPVSVFVSLFVTVLSLVFTNMALSIGIIYSLFAFY